MRRLHTWILVAILGSCSFASGQSKWVTLKGQVLASEADAKSLSTRTAIAVTADKEHCESKGQLLQDSVLINPKSRGVRNVVVWLRPATQDRASKLPTSAIHPDLSIGKAKTVNHVIDQPCCQFVPRITLAREGDTLEVKNSAPVNHNVKWMSSENGEFNVNLGPGQSHKLPSPLKAERTPVGFECNVHPWMKGQVRVFDHPYFALTDEEGLFEIKNAPVGTFHIVYAHEKGFHKGTEGRYGWPLEIKDSGTGVMQAKPVEFVFPK